MNAHIKPPAEPQGAPLYLPTDITPETIFQAIGRLRKEAADEIDRLLAFLDSTEPDPDLEPWLANPGYGSAAGGDDREMEDEHDEPSLGSVGDVHFDQERWAAGTHRDLEMDDGETGIADQEGLDEQVPFRDWQGVGMV